MISKVLAAILRRNSNKDIHKRATESLRRGRDDVASLSSEIAHLSKEADRKELGARTWLLSHARAELPDTVDHELFAQVFHEEGFQSPLFQPNKEALARSGTRASVFDALMSLRTGGSWADQLEVSSRHTISATRDSEAGRALAVAEHVLCGLMRSGFKPRKNQISPILEFLLTSPPGAVMGIPDELGKDGERTTTLGILPALAKIFPTAEDVPVEAKPPLERLAERYLQLNTSEDWTSPGRDGDISPPDVDALMAMTGRKRDSVFLQAQRLPTARIGVFRPDMPIDQYLHVLKRLDDALDRLIPEFEQSNGRPTWVESGQSYSEIFGTWPDEGAKFGWWEIEREGRQAWEVAFDRVQYEKMRAPGVYSSRLSLLDVGQTLLADPWQDKPVSFFRKTVPAVEMFDFNGKDPAGQLLEHLSSIRSGKPTKSWLGKAERIIEKIGEEVVAGTLAQWLDLVREIVDGEKGETAYECALRHAPIAATKMYMQYEPPTDDLAWADRQALRLMRIPHVLTDQKAGNPGLSPDEVLDELGHSAVIPEMPSFVLTGTLAIAPYLSKSIPPSVIGNVATYCFRPAGYPEQALRSRMAGNAAVHALGRVGTPEAAKTLEQVRDEFAGDKSIVRRIDAEQRAIATHT